MTTKLRQGRFFGEPVCRRDVEELALIETSYAAGLRTPRHVHERDCFCVVLAGGFDETYGSRTRSCARSTVLFRPAGEDHANHFPDGARCLNVELGESWSQRLAEVARPTSSSLDLTHSPSSSLSSTLYREFCAGDDLSWLAIEGLVLEMLAVLARRLRTGDRGRPEWLARAVAAIRERSPNQISVRELAAMVGVHPAHLSRSFRLHHGCTIGDYVRRLRVERACHLLTSSRLSLAEVALESGFAHQSHLTNTFRLLLGVTPARYRSTRGARRPVS